MGGQAENEPLVTRRQIINRINYLPLVVDNKTKDKILASIPKETLRVVYEAKDDDWLPATLYMEINERICDEIGEQGSYDLSFKSFNKMIASSTIGQLLKSTMSLIRIKPTIGAKLCAKFWKSIYQNLGEMTVNEKGKNQIQIVLSNIPIEAVKNRNILMGFAGGINAILSVSGYEAKVVIEAQSAEKKEVSFIASWNSDSKNEKTDIRKI